MTKSDPYHNQYECPICSDDVSVALPIADKFVTCPSCNSKLEVSIDAEFERGMWHDRTELCPAEDEEEKHMKRMVEFAETKKKEPLTPTQLAEAISDLKKRYPKNFPK